MHTHWHTHWHMHWRTHCRTHWRTRTATRTGTRTATHTATHTATVVTQPQSDDSEGEGRGGTTGRRVPPHWQCQVWPEGNTHVACGAVTPPLAHKHKHVCTLTKRKNVRAKPPIAGCAGAVHTPARVHRDLVSWERGPAAAELGTAGEPTDTQ